MKKGIFYCYLLAAVFTISACSIQKNKEVSEYNNNNIVENSSTTSFNEASDDFNRYLQENVGKKISFTADSVAMYDDDFLSVLHIKNVDIYGKPFAIEEEGEHLYIKYSNGAKDRFTGLNMGIEGEIIETSDGARIKVLDGYTADKTFEEYLRAHASEEFEIIGKPIKPVTLNKLGSEIMLSPIEVSIKSDDFIFKDGDTFNVVITNDALERMVSKHKQFENDKLAHFYGRVLEDSTNTLLVDSVYIPDK